MRPAASRRAGSAQLLDAVPDPGRDLALLQQRQLLHLAVRREQRHGVAVGLEAGVAARHVVRNEEVAALARELAPGRRDHVPALRREADHDAAAALAADLGEDVRVLDQAELEPRALGELL